jgi:hypothetical protein
LDQQKKSTKLAAAAQAVVARRMRRAVPTVDNVLRGSFGLPEPFVAPVSGLSIFCLPASKVAAPRSRAAHPPLKKTMTGLPNAVSTVVTDRLRPNPLQQGAQMTHATGSFDISMKPVPPRRKGRTAIAE